MSTLWWIFFIAGNPLPLKEANKLSGTTGTFWKREYFDRSIRNGSELERTVSYVVENR